jgi:hypothetical protein
MGLALLRRVKHYFFTMLRNIFQKLLPAVLVGVVLGGVTALAAPIYRVERTLLPETTNTYELGTSSKQWLRVFTETLCLNGSCLSAWPGSSGAGNKTLAWATSTDNVLTYLTTQWSALIGGTATTSDARLSVVGSTTVTGTGIFGGELRVPNIVATSSATSTFMGSLAVSSSPNYVLADPRLIVGDSLTDTRAQLAVGRVILGSPSWDTSQAYLGLSGIANSASNYVLKIASPATIVNAPYTSGEVRIRSNGTNVGLFTASGLSVNTSTPAVSKIHSWESSTEVGSGGGITIEQNSTGDVLTQYLLAGVRRWVTGIDNSDNDSFGWSPVTDLANKVMTLTTGGNLGIGTSSPYSKLSVAGPVAADSFNATNTQATSTISGRMTIGYGVATGVYQETGSPLYVQSQGINSSSLLTKDQYLMLRQVNGVNNEAVGIGFDLTSGLYSPASQASGAILYRRVGSAGYGNMEFYTRPSGGTPTQKMVITSDGNLGIGTTSPYAKLSVVGPVVAGYFTATSTTASTFPYASTTAITTTATSTMGDIYSSAGLLSYARLNVTGAGTSTILTGALEALNFNMTGTATSTAAGGINITSWVFCGERGVCGRR